MPKGRMGKVTQGESDALEVQMDTLPFYQWGKRLPEAQVPSSAANASSEWLEEDKRALDLAIGLTV